MAGLPGRCRELNIVVDLQKFNRASIIMEDNLTEKTVNIIVIGLIIIMVLVTVVALMQPMHYVLRH